MSVGRGDLVKTIVSWLYGATGAYGLTSPFAFVGALGISAHPACTGGAQIVGDRLIWDPRMPPARQRALVLREVARWLLRRFDQIDTDAAAVELAVRINAYGVRRAGLRLVTASSEQAPRLGPVSGALRLGPLASVKPDSGRGFRRRLLRAPER